MIINGLKDLRKVSYIARTPAWMSQFSLRVFASLVQTRMVHPDWTLDDAISYMVNDEFMDETEIVAAFGGRVEDIVPLWTKAEAAAKDALKNL